MQKVFIIHLKGVAKYIPSLLEIQWLEQDALTHTLYYDPETSYTKDQNWDLFWKEKVWNYRVHTKFRIP